MARSYAIWLLSFLSSSPVTLTFSSVSLTTLTSPLLLNCTIHVFTPGPLYLLLLLSSDIQTRPAYFFTSFLSELKWMNYQMNTDVQDPLFSKLANLTPSRTASLLLFWKFFFLVLITMWHYSSIHCFPLPFEYTWNKVSHFFQFLFVHCSLLMAKANVWHIANTE